MPCEYYNKIFLYIGVKCSEGKDVGEMWVAVIKTISSIPWASMASNGCPLEWGQSQSQYMARRGPCRTYSRGASSVPLLIRYRIMSRMCLLWPMLSRCNNRFFFHRLKINHESHEFILDPGTVANSIFNASLLLLWRLCRSWGLPHTRGVSNWLEKSQAEREIMHEDLLY